MFELWGHHDPRHDDPEGGRVDGREGLWHGRSGAPAGDCVIAHREAARGPVAPPGAREQAQHAQGEGSGGDEFTRRTEADKVRTVTGLPAGALTAAPAPPVTITTPTS